MTLLQHVLCSSSATAARRQEDLSECNWKDLTLTSHNGYCPPVHVLIHTFLLIRVEGGRVFTVFCKAESPREGNEDNRSSREIVSLGGLG